MPTRTITVRVTPRSSRNELRYEAGALSAKLNAPPVDGAANEACRELIADTLHIAKSRVAVIKGHKSRIKTLAVEGFEGEWPWENAG
ncbi:MAG TPA: DUF167 domain-containing protein [Capsulimonadaceae bacterium]|jgi:hypothetical protein